MRPAGVAERGSAGGVTSAPIPEVEPRFGRRTGLPVSRLPVVAGEHNGETENGEVLATVSDHHGGYYIGGAFSMTGALPAAIWRT